MKIFCAFVLIVLFLSCQNSETDKLKGTWKFLSITSDDTAIYNNHGIVPLLWLNVLAQQTTIYFDANTVTINDTLKKSYRVQNDKLYVDEEEAEFVINDDTLKLTSLPQKDLTAWFIRNPPK